MNTDEDAFKFLRVFLNLQIGTTREKKIQIRKIIFSSLVLLFSQKIEFYLDCTTKKMYLNLVVFAIFVNFIN